jgi:class 3 adenylate cyclase
MFVDLVGSTALSARLDPEDMREVLRSYQDAVTREVTCFGGHVAKEEAALLDELASPGSGPALRV